MFSHGKQYLEPVLSQANKVNVNPGEGHCGIYWDYLFYNASLLLLHAILLFIKLIKIQHIHVNIGAVKFKLAENHVHANAVIFKKCVALLVQRVLKHCI